MPEAQHQESPSGTTTPSEPAVSIPPVTEVSNLPDLPAPPADLADKPVPGAAYAVQTATADQAFAKDFDKAKSDLVKAQGDYTAAQQAYALAVANYNSALQQARATQTTSYNDANAAFDKTC